MKIQVETAKLRAAALFVADSKDTRIALQHIYLDGGYIVASRGHALFAAKIGGETFPDKVLIDSTDLKNALKGIPTRSKLTTLELYDNGLYIGVGSAICRTRDYRFPDWKRVIPSETGKAPLVFDGELLVRAAKALKFFGFMNLEAYSCWQFTDHCAVLQFRDLLILLHCLRWKQGAPDKIRFLD